MRHFFQLNRHKLRFAFQASSVVFVAFVSIAFLLAFLNRSVPDYSLMIIVFLFAGLVFPCFTIFIAYLAWYYKQWAKRKAFSAPPLDQLHVLGFTDKLQGEKTKWAFTEEVKAGTINGFELIADVLYNDRQTIEVKALTAWRQIDKNEYQRLSNEFRLYDIEFDIGCLVKRYHTKRMYHLGIDDLKTDLEAFTLLLKQNGFEPISEPAGFNM